MARTFTAVVERDTDTGLYVAFVPGLPGAHTQAESLDELSVNLKEVVEMLREDGELHVEAFAGVPAVNAVSPVALRLSPGGTQGAPTCALALSRRYTR